MSKLNEKQDPKVTKTLEQSIIELRGAVREAEEIMTLRAHPGWTRLQDNIKAQLDDVERELDSFEALPERALVLKLKERKDFRWVIGVVDKVESKLPELHNALAGVEKQLVERKAKGATGQL